jgi:hypothetical protein
VAVENELLVVFAGCYHEVLWTSPYIQAFHATQSDRVSERVLEQHASNLTALDRWLKDIDRAPVTGWRWRKLGWIQTINICGRLYVSRDEIKRFEKRAAAGEFSKIPKTPSRKAASR